MFPQEAENARAKGTVKLKIAVIAPYPGLKQTAEKIAAQFPEIVIKVVVADLEDAIGHARKFEQNGFHVLLSRGGTAKILREASSLPVVEIQVSGYDILRTLLLVKDSQENIELIGFPNVCKGLKEVSSLVETYIPYQTVNRAEEVETAILSAKNRGVQLVIGDTITNKLAKKYAMQSIMITSGAEAMRDAFFQAQKIAEVIIENQRTTARYREFYHRFPEGIFIFNRAGDILFYNEAGRRLFEFTEGITHVEQLPRTMQENFQELTSHNYAAEQVTYQGAVFIVTGETLTQSGNKEYILKISEESRYSLEMPGFSLQPLQAGSFSFSQFLLIDEKLKTVVKAIKQRLESENYIFLAGERGTGKRSIASAVHHEKYKWRENLWYIHIREGMRKEDLQMLQKQISHLHATFYIEGWEHLAEADLKDLTRLLSLYKNYGVFVRETLSSQQKENKEEQIFFQMPPLRERMNYLEEYIKLFLAAFNTKYGKQVIRVEESLLQEWKEAEWSENLAELEEVIKRGVQEADASVILPEDIKHTSESKKYNTAQTLDEIEKEIINHVLEEENFNQSAAAKRLGINRSTLWRKLK